MTHSLHETLLRRLQHYKHILANNRLVVGVSGGADSIVLLHSLMGLRNIIGFELHIATLNHGLRGQESLQDVEFVQNLAQSLELPITVGHINVLQHNQIDKLGLEASARKARYEFLAQVAQSVDSKIVAVGHHANDQAETVMMRILRGTGLVGLRGMSFQSPMPYYPTVQLIRPLLSVTRTEIEAYCHEHNLDYREDSTNQDTKLVRNAIRLELFPILHRLNPQIISSLKQLSEIATLSQDFIETHFQETVIPNLIITGDLIQIPSNMFEKLHPAIQQYCLYWATNQLKQGDKIMQYQHIQAMLEFANEGQVGTKMSLPDHLQLHIGYDALILKHEKAPMPTGSFLLLTPSHSIMIEINTIQDIPQQEWSIHLSTNKFDNYSAKIDIPPQAKIILRTRKPGDRFAPLGMQGKTRKLKDWMIDRKIPHYLRDSIPLLEINGEIAVIIFNKQWTISESVAIKSTTKNIYYLGAVVKSRTI